MESRPRLVLLGRKSIRGENLHRALRDVCTVKWIARKSEFKPDIRSPLLLLREFLRLLAACRSAPVAKPPIVIVHAVGLDAIPAFAVRRITGCKVILYATGPDVLGAKTVAHSSFLRWAVKNAELVLCENAKIEKEVRILGGEATRILPAPFVPFEYGIEKRKEYDIVTVGRLTDGAKQSLLVEASEFLDPSIRIAIIGEGPQRQYLTTLSRQHGRSQVFFLGEMPRKWVHRMLRNSNLYVQCSSVEGAPTSALEAVCCGLPVITLCGDQDPELRELYGLRPIVPDDRKAVSLATTIEEAMENYPSLLPDVALNREALESYSRSWPRMAGAAIFS